MTRRNLIHSISTLVQVRSVEVERMEADLARQEATRQRYQTSVNRLTALAEGSGASGALAPALALNCGQYKQAVFALADTHRTDLQLHEANMAASQRHLSAAWTRRELLGKVLEQQQGLLSRERDRAAKKREDDIATQAWMANQE